MSTVRVRFAPSPTGSLHIGSARTALFNFVFARHQGGVFVLRIEDTDMKRSLQVHEHSITRDLHWLGLSADEGPDVGGAYGPYRQSERAHIYEEGVLRLLAEGHAYRCFCSQERLDALKEDQLARGRMPKYDRRCLGLTEEEVQQRLAAGEQATVRFRIPQGQVDYQDMIRGRLSFSADVIGDFIIKRTDGGFSYNYAVVMDDMGMKITHVIRGEDHVTNTARQLLLFQAFGVEPPTYAHHSMIHAPDGASCPSATVPPALASFEIWATCPKPWSTTWRCWVGIPAMSVNSSAYRNWCRNSPWTACPRARPFSIATSSTGSTACMCAG